MAMKPILSMAERLELALAATGAAVAWTGPDGRVRWSNADFDALAGRPHADVLGRPVERLLPLRSRAGDPLAENPAAAALRSRTLTTGVYRLGDAVIDFRAAWIAVDGDEPMAVFSLRAASDADRQFRLFVDAVRDYAIVMLDPSGRIVSWNGGAERIKGYKAEEIIGKDFSLFYSDDETRRDEPGAVLRQAEAEGRVERESVWRRRKDGSRFLANIVVSAVRSEAGRLQGFAVVTRDVTEASMRAAELTRSNAELERFASAASHDLLEPLRKISAFGDLLDKQAGARLDERGRDFLFRIRRAAVRMSQLVEDLLRYSRVFGDARPFERVDLNEVAASVVAGLDLGPSGAKAQVSIGRLTAVWAHPFQMHQLMQNLIANAVKFHRPGQPARVEVSARDGKPGFVDISVSDDGIGFDPGQAERIFEPFVRLHTRAEYEGTGLGLAICRRIAMRHGGWISASAQPDRGAVFIVTLPLRSAP